MILCDNNEITHYELLSFEALTIKSDKLIFLSNKILTKFPVCHLTRNLFYIFL